MGAFYGCRKLKTVNFEYVKFINAQAFEGTGLNGVLDFTGKKLSSGETEGGVLVAISDYAFRGCKLTKIILPKTAQSIGIGSFANNTDLSSIEMFAPKVKIGENAFYRCTSLKTVDINAAVISPNAFRGCTNLTTVNLGRDVSVIGENAFNGTNVSKYNLDPRNTNFTVKENGAMLFIGKWNYQRFRGLATPLLGLAILLLAAVLIPGVGITRNGATRWLGFGDMFTFQPSEIAKIAVVIYFANSISRKKERMRTFFGGIVPYAIWLCIIGGLVVMEPHLSGTILILGAGAVLMLVGGINWGWVFAALAAAAGGMYTLLFVIGYNTSRITYWHDPWADLQGKGYQLAQSLISIGSGGLLGLGLGKGRQKFLYLPEEHNDFIFAVVCEELGFSSSMRKHYENASEYLAIAALPTAYTDDDPANANSNYKRYVKAYSDYQSAFAILDEVELRTNASKFVEIVNILIERESEWFTDDGTCRRLWQKAREIVLGNRYDAQGTPGFENAYLIFTNLGGINDTFWNYIQLEHVALLQEKLDGFNAPEITYIGRYAIITYIDHYVNVNSDMIDPSNTKVAEIYAISENYRKNLTLYEQDYLKMLEENSSKFMDLIEVIKQMTTYEQIKPLFDEATDCYYGMDIPDDETMAAVAYYEELAIKMSDIETDCVILGEAVKEIAAATNNDELYAALVKGYACLDNADVTIAGVKANLDAYNAAYNAYMSTVGAMNDELSAATDVVSSVRSYCGIDDLVDYVSTIVE